MKEATFTKDFDFRASTNVIFSYKKGQTYPNVLEAHYEAAVKAGAIEAAEPAPAEPKADAKRR